MNDLAVLSSVSPAPIKLSKNVKFKRFPFNFVFIYHLFDLTEENIWAPRWHTNLKTIVLINTFDQKFLFGQHSKAVFFLFDIYTRIPILYNPPKMREICLCAADKTFIQILY